MKPEDIPGLSKSVLQTCFTLLTLYSQVLIVGTNLDALNLIV